MAEMEKVTEAVAWTNELPESGGVWGHALRSTAEQMEGEMAALVRTRDELSEKISGRRKILKETAKRAEKEAKLLYSDKAIESAKSRHKKTESQKTEPEAEPEKVEKAKSEPDKSKSKASR